jgi:hypothetical protein
MQLFYSYTIQILSGYNIPVNIACKEGRLGAAYVRGIILLLTGNASNSMYVWEAWWIIF